ncbi:ABC-2 type transport system permease protein [Lederbergia galactosidilyticus]|uniref:ABC transporter permease n=1 Tax=Lederbergia galactosidilytica TaxID=217031 RepID=UPI001AE923F9|nr:ABC transporter permease [Lederbergia galactosidilytica]MBP1917430.1 ABC-2 type transport system permease protein [Lederbergia galactosidilytica]
MNIFSHYKYVFQIQFLRNAGFLIFMILIQILISIGIVIGFTYLIPTPDTNTILFLATGAPTIILIFTGLVILPQQVGTAKSDGYMEFLRTLPVNRAVILGADTTIWLIITVPGIVISSLVAHLLFSPGYDISWTVVPALLMIALTSIGVGYGFSYLLSPTTSLALSQVIVFGALMFSPVNFPMDRLPEWLQTLHEILPIYSMAEIMRASLAASTFEATLANYINLLVWCVLGFGGAIFILNKK